VSRKELNAAIWLNNAPLPGELCDASPVNRLYGFYRRLNDGTLEFVSFCNPDAADWVSMHKDDFKRLLDQATRPGKNKKNETDEQVDEAFKKYQLDDFIPIGL
jgi:hypothetical protein